MVSGLPCRSVLCRVAQCRVALWFVALAAILALARGADARDRDRFAVVLVVPAPSFTAPVIIERPEAAPWLPTPGPLSPTRPPPAARCYAGPVTCPLASAAELGRSCACVSNGGREQGRGLIPPSPVPVAMPRARPAHQTPVPPTRTLRSPAGSA